MSPALRWSLAALGALAALAIVGPLLLPIHPQPAFTFPPYLGPCADFWFGVDPLGRPLAPRLVAGLRLTLSISILVATSCAVVGAALGAVSGYMGGWFDLIFQRIVDILLAFPGLLLAISLAAFLGPGAPQLVLALSATGWIGFARLARGQAMMLRDKEFIQAAQGLGYSPLRIVTGHLIPNLVAPLLVQGSFALAAAALGESSLSFLGLGLPDTPSLGSLIRDGARDLMLAPHLSIFPGLLMMAAILLFNFVGDRLRDRWDVRGEMEAP